jgi:6-phosphogluconolactonase
MLVFIGGYTEPDRNGRGDGIYVHRMDAATGQLERLRIVGGVANPSFLALHPDGLHLYSVNGGEASGVSAFALDPAAADLTFLNRQPSQGENPAHLSVDQSGRYVAVANFTGGTVALFPLDPDGRLAPASDVVRHTGPPGQHPTRQDRSHPHQIASDPGGPFALVNDLGLDRTYVYRLDREPGRLVPNDQPFVNAAPGAGPRHLAFHPSRRFVYVLNEIDSTIQLFRYDGQGGILSPVARVSTLPTDWSGENSTAQIVAHPGGRFVYASNRGHDSIAIFAVDEASGRLTAAGHEPTRGRAPRNFNLDPSGAFLLAANQDSDTVVPFRVDGASGRLTATGQVVEAGSPSCVVFLDA